MTAKVCPPCLTCAGSRAIAPFHSVGCPKSEVNYTHACDKCGSSSLMDQDQILCRRCRAPVPRYSEAKGWQGGNDRALYAFTDNHTGTVVVRPAWQARGIGPECSVRLATRREAIGQWGSNHLTGWIIDD